MGTLSGGTSSPTDVAPFLGGVRSGQALGQVTCFGLKAGGRINTIIRFHRPEPQMKGTTLDIFC